MSKEKGSASDDSFERLAIPPDEHDVILTDINERGLEELGEQEGIINLSSATFPEILSPIDGVIYGENKRPMICLPCCRAERAAATIHIWFIVDTGSNCNFLAKKTIEALVRDEDPVPRALRVAIQDPNSKIECPYPHLTNTSDANILGMEALKRLGLSIVIDWKDKEFKLARKEDIFFRLTCTLNYKDLITANTKPPLLLKFFNSLGKNKN